MQRVSFKFLEFYMPHNNLTIDFNDASFDEANTDVQGPGGVDVDVVFPISDDVNFAVSRADNRPGSENSVGVGSGTASAIALMPDAATANLMDEFLFEFENDIDPSDAAKNDQGLKVTFKGYDTNQNREVLSDINITGSFENLHDGGTLDLHIDRGTHNSQAIVQSITLGAPENNPGNQNAILVSGDNGANLGAGNDVVEINVDASADMTGIYQGGSGTDVLKLIEGLPENNGAIVDFGGSIPGDEDSKQRTAHKRNEPLPPAHWKQITNQVP
jgi:hypothetical protein